MERRSREKLEPDVCWTWCDFMLPQPGRTCTLGWHLGRLFVQSCLRKKSPAKHPVWKGAHIQGSLSPARGSGAQRLAVSITGRAGQCTELGIRLLAQGQGGCQLWQEGGRGGGREIGRKREETSPCWAPGHSKWSQPPTVEGRELCLIN